MFVDLVFSRFDTFLLESIQPTKHKVNEHLSGGEWIRTGLLESIKPTKDKVNEHLSGGEWIPTGLLESIKPTTTQSGFIHLHWDVR
jgi:ABC-type cobalamin transport system ATPase subunit